MLVIRYRSRFTVRNILIVCGGLIVLGAGLYFILLSLSPAIAHRFFIQPLTVSTLPKPKDTDNRLVIPKLGVNISYDTPSSSLAQNAQWRDSSLGNPKDGGTMILVAHKFSLRTTLQQTITQSPFYALDTLRSGDKCVVDYQGARYGYEITDVNTGAVSSTPVPSNTSEDQLVIYTYDSENDTTRVVITAKPLGKVAL